MPHVRHPGFPARPLLRPGVRLCRREDGRIQIGLGEHLAVTAPDTVEVHQVLEALRNGVPPAPPPVLGHDVRRLCAALLEHDLVLDADTFLAALGAEPSPSLRESLSALFCDRHGEAAALLARRGDIPVEVSHRGLPRAAQRLSQLLDDAGVDLDRQPLLAVHLSRGEPDRERFDDWIRDDLPHVVLVCSEGTVTAGPFVVPGQTACVRCVDAHHTDRDPRRALIVAQYAAATDARDGLPEPIHHDLVEMAVLWLARDIVNWIDGRVPRTWSTSIDFDADLELPLTEWRQHPSCGCAWGRAVAF